MRGILNFVPGPGFRSTSIGQGMVPIRDLGLTAPRRSHTSTRTTVSNVFR